MQKMVDVAIFNRRKLYPYKDASSSAKIKKKPLNVWIGIGRSPKISILRSKRRLPQPVNCTLRT